MSVEKVNSSNFALAMSDILKDINEGVQKAVNEAVPKAGRKGAKVLRTVSPISSSSTSGKYRKGWSCKIENYLMSTHATIYNKSPGMPHLLENGHDVYNQYGNTGKRAAAIPHIGQGLEAAEQEIDVQMAKGLEKL